MFLAILKHFSEILETLQQVFEQHKNFWEDISHSSGILFCMVCFQNFTDIYKNKCKKVPLQKMGFG